MGERWRCTLCGFQVRGRDRVAAHLSKAHGMQAEAWADRGLAHAEASFLSFLKAAGSLGSGSFALADGLRARLPTAGPPPDVRQSIGRDLERALRFDDPGGPEAVADALNALPAEAQEMVFRLHELSTGVGAYIAPLEGLNPDLAASRDPQFLSASISRRGRGETLHE
mmetsp:Transcript_35693/g.112159  ORF Transcript_35693/g.112159 Transcript_35693/m.112159 type:complete len:168 (+) Transcript_35693:1-504(+)